MDVNITLPHRITDVKNIMVRNAEIPLSFYNISSSIGNNNFTIIDEYDNAYGVIIPDGFYTMETLSTVMNQEISNAMNVDNDIEFTPDLSFSYISTSLRSKFTAINAALYTLVFVSPNSNTSFKNTLGWLLGFRSPSDMVFANDPVTLGVLTSPCVYNIHQSKYLYLVIDEFSKGNQNSFICPQYDSLIRKNIIAKIAVHHTGYGFGDILSVNNFNGLLLTDKRSYTGKVDLQKFNIQLIDETGLPINLNGSDFSFCIEVEHE